LATAPLRLFLAIPIVVLTLLGVIVALRWDHGWLFLALTLALLAGYGVPVYLVGERIRRRVRLGGPEAAQMYERRFTAMWKYIGLGYVAMLLSLAALLLVVALK
jgi:hypothetical protein